METFLETGSGRSRRGGRAEGLGRFQESLTICDQLTDTEQVNTSFSPMSENKSVLNSVHFAQILTLFREVLIVE